MPHENHNLTVSTLIIGCGYVGRAIGAAIAHAGGEVVGVTMTAHEHPQIVELGIRPVAIDACDATVLKPLVRGHTHIVLCAGRGRGSVDDYHTTYGGITSALSAAVPGSAIRHIVYTSSTRVYSECGGGWVTEESELAAPGTHGGVLQQAEQRLLENDGRCRVTVLRLGGLHGPGRALVDRVASSAGQTRDDGQHYINLVDLPDVVSAVLRVIAAGIGGVMNLVDGHPMVRRELYDRVLASRGLAPVQWRGLERAVTGKRVRACRAAQQLGFRPTPAALKWC